MSNETDNQPSAVSPVTTVAMSTRNGTSVSAIEPATRELVIIALGNRFRGDDAVGPVIAERLSLRHPRLPVIEGCDDSMSIINAWRHASLALVVDAACSGAQAGTIHTLDAVANPFPKELARCSSHGVGLAEALAMSRVLGRLPRHIMIYAIEGACFDTGAALSSPVAAAVGTLIEQLESDWAIEFGAIEHHA